jgi:glycosyltransferase involved in cell wall biosynthesis
MRILLIAPIPPDRDAQGAIPSVLAAQLSGLSERNHVTVVCVAGPDPRDIRSVQRLREAGVDVHAVIRGGSGWFRAWERRVRLAYGWLVLRRPWRTVWFADERLQGLVDELLAEQAFDVVVAEDDAMGVLRFDSRVPTVLTVHELGRSRPAPSSGHLRRTRDRLAKMDWRRWPGYQRAVCSRFDLLVVFTDADRERVAELDPRLAARVRVVPFGVELPQLDADQSEVPDTLVFAGNYTHPPNVEAASWLAEQILPRVQAQRPAVQLLLAGPEAPARVRDLGRLAGVRVLGGVPSLDPLLASACCVMAPVRSGGGMRMKVLQAMAGARAVVTTPLGAAGLEGMVPLPLAIGGDADEIATLTLSLLADKERRRSLGLRARELVAERYSPEAWARRLEIVYTEAISLAGERAR